MFPVLYIIHTNRNFSLNSLHDLKWDGSYVSQILTALSAILVQYAILSLTRHTAGANTYIHILLPGINFSPTSTHKINLRTNQHPKHHTNHLNHEHMSFLPTTTLNRETTARGLHLLEYTLHQPISNYHSTPSKYRYLLLLNHSSPSHSLCTIPPLLHP